MGLGWYWLVGGRAYNELGYSNTFLAGVAACGYAGPLAGVCGYAGVGGLYL